MSKKSFARLTRIVTGTFGYGKEDGFSLETGLTKFEQFVHFWVLVWRSFVRNRCPVRAAALSYTTLLALIPMLAVAMSLSTFLLKSKGEEQIGAFIEQFIAYVVPDAPKLTNSSPSEFEFPIGPANAPSDGETSPSNTTSAVQVSETSMTPAVAASSLAKDARVVAATGRGAAQIKQFLQRANSGTLGTLGGLFLFWTAIMMLIRIEETFNDIWGVTQGRDWWPRITNYFFAIVFGPVLLITAISLTSGAHFQKTRNLLGLMPFFEPVVSQLLPVVMISMTFAVLYKLMPNTQVRFSAAFVGGLLAGTAWHIFNLLSLHLGSSAMNANKLYAGLALVPLLMVGLYVVWVIVLFGAQVAYAFQNRESYLQERLAENVNQRGREFVALRLMTCIGQHFQHSWPPSTVPQMSRELGIPSKLIQQVLQTLLAARLVVEVHGAESGYAPARPLETINCHHILLAMRATQGQELVTRDEPVRAEVIGEFARIQAAEKAAASTVTMLALVNRAQARLDLVALTGPEAESQSLPALAEVRPPVELPGEKPLGEPLPEVNFAEPIEPVEPVAPKENKPVSVVSIPSGAPSAASATTDDNQSFPL